MLWNLSYLPQILRLGGIRAAADDLAGQYAKPDLELIEPRAVLGC